MSYTCRQIRFKDRQAWPRSKYCQNPPHYFIYKVQKNIWTLSQSHSHTHNHLFSSLLGIFPKYENTSLFASIFAFYKHAVVPLGEQKAKTQKRKTKKNLVFVFCLCMPQSTKNRCEFWSFAVSKNKKTKQIFSHFFFFLVLCSPSEPTFTILIQLYI